MIDKLTFVTILFFSSIGFAEVVEFPDEELAQESVLPLFDKVEVVKQRRVETAKHFDIGAGIGFNMTEALYNNQNFNINFTYNLTNIHAINFTGIFLSGGLSNMGKDLAAGKGLDGVNQKFDPSLAPEPVSFYNLNYQVTTYYGKISINKDLVYNLTLHGIVGLTNANFADSSNLGLNFGFGQKLYFTQRLGFRLDLDIMIYNGPDPTSMGLNNSDVKTSSELDDKTYFETVFNFGVIYVL